jgi:hypothetical protein
LTRPLGPGPPEARRTPGRAGPAGGRPPAGIPRGPARRAPLVRVGQVLLADKGFAGRDFEGFVHDTTGAHLIRPDRRGEPTRHGTLARCRQWIEAIIDTLKGQLTLEDHGGRTLTGVHARVAARLLALTAAIWHNHKINAPVKRSLIAYNH